MSFFNQHFLITGAAGGIGRELVYELLQKGAIVSAAGRDLKSLQKLKDDLQERPGLSKEWQERLHLVVADLSSQKGCARCVKQAKQKGPLGVLIHTAGVGMRALARDVSPGVFEEIIKINFYSLFHLYQAAREDLLSSRGQIVAISSVQAYVALPGRSAYVAGKHALHGLMKTLRLEEPQLSFLTVTAGYIRTGFSSKALSAEGQKYGKFDAAQKKGVAPDVAAKKIIEALQKRKREIIISGIKERAAIWVERYFPALYERIARNHAP